MENSTVEIKPTLPEVITHGSKFYTVNSADGNWQEVDLQTVMLAIEKAGYSTTKPKDGKQSPAREALLTIKTECRVKRVLDRRPGCAPGVQVIDGIKTLVLENAPQPTVMAKDADSLAVEQLLQEVKKGLVVPELCYHNTKHLFLRKNPSGQWIELKKEDLQMHLQEAGFNPDDGSKESFLTEVDQIIHTTQMDNTIELAGEIAGWKAGIHDNKGCRFLVKRGLQLPQPVKGNCVELKAFFESLLPDGQVHYYYGWLKHSLEGLYYDNMRYGKAVILVGNPDCGKTLCLEVTTEIMGGRCAKPHSYMQGDTSFNEDLAGAEVWCIDDENNAATSHWDRRKFGARIKTVTADKMLRMHPKGQKAIALPVHVRLMVTTNFEPQNLLIIPPMDDSLKDKVLIFKCDQAIIPPPPPGVKSAAWQLLDRVFKPQIPAFVHWLLNDYALPVELANSRYGVAAFQHSEVMDELYAKSREGILLELIDKAQGVLSITATPANAVIKNTTTGATHNTVIHTWRGTSLELSAILSDTKQTTAGEAKKILDWADGCGTYLGNLKNDAQHGWRFNKYRTRDTRSWGIALKPTLADDEVVESIAWPS